MDSTGGNMAKLHFKYGAMNSGKSSALINTAYNYEEKGLSILITKPSIDTKGGTSIVARAGLQRKVDFLLNPTMSVRKEVEKRSRSKKQLDCILIDEAQFLSPSQVDELLDIAKNDGISVIAFGLRSDFRRTMFPGSMRLFELADNIVKLPTMCECGSQAEFNTRKEDGSYVFNGDQIAIDGEKQVTYDSLCGVCYLREMNTQST